MSAGLEVLSLRLDLCQQATALVGLSCGQVCGPASRRMSRDAVTGKTLPTSLLFLPVLTPLCGSPLSTAGWAWSLQGT